MKCSNCGKEIEGNYSLCDECIKNIQSYKQLDNEIEEGSKEQEKTRKSLVMAIASIVLGAFIIFIYFVDGYNCGGECSDGDMSGCFCGLFYGLTAIFTFPFSIVLLVGCIRSLKKKFNIFLVLGILLLSIPMFGNIIAMCRMETFGPNTMVIFLALIIAIVLGYIIGKKTSTKAYLISMLIPGLATFGISKYLFDISRTLSITLQASFVIMFIISLLGLNDKEKCINKKSDKKNI